MLREITEFVVKNRDSLIVGMKNENYTKIIEEAKKSWNAYTPKKEKCAIASIDSSYNVGKFQGLQLWAIDAVAINIKSEFLSKKYQIGLGMENKQIADMSTEMEGEAYAEIASSCDLVLMDGSPYSHFTTKGSTIKQLKKILQKNNNGIFFSKNSNSNSLFEKYGSFAADIFYFNHASRAPGFSDFYVDYSHGKDKPIISSYIRLQQDAPLGKIELVINGITKTEFKEILNKLVSEAVGGYPRSLKMAHNECKINSKNIDALIHILGIKNEVGSRDILE